MVLYFHNSHSFNHDFPTVTLAYFNRYPNPYSAHVLSIDTIDIKFDKEGRLHQTKLILKEGRLPLFIKPILGHNGLKSWILEESIVDLKKQTLKTYTRNLDHTKIIRIEEYNEYEYDVVENKTLNKVTVLFKSGFKNNGFGIRNRIEQWSKSKFGENLFKSQEGMKFVIESTRNRLSAGNKTRI
ncbi:hypothetical protein CANARDRAFT_174544 [[Candida] arabinofermentans NRRL YB-2248]|uniref:PRELI/MSF1 domain-containing protein n=1 Tax=[Candida] arabinofermentans NRRL YB-2248 TaxID=983967 RepID=A0A1E4T6Y6_9ASCO|nr:hypothetical protein CANARDRAFT_174544 [[Candida] arabinofermentans NRRL YB-2248]